MTKFNFGILVAVGVGALTIWFGSVKDGFDQPPVKTSKADGGPADQNTITRRAHVEYLSRHRKARREGIEQEPSQQEGNHGAVTKNEEAASTPEPQMTAAELVKALADAAAKADAGLVQALWQKLPRSAECIEALEGLVTAQDCSKDLRRYAGEALVRIGTQESVGFLLDQALAAESAGDSSRASGLLDSLDSPTTPEGARALLDLLLGTGRYAEHRNDLPEEFRAAARKALRNAPDREVIGTLTAQLYLDPEIGGRQEAVLELFDGVAHPNMLSALAVRSLQAGSEDNARQFLDRIARLDDQGVVRALVQAGSTEAGLFNPAAERLYGWSRQHPEQAQAGLFLEYVNDSNRTSNERILAAYGLVGVANRDETLRAFSKTLAEESDPEVRARFAALEVYLEQNGAP